MSGFDIVLLAVAALLINILRDKVVIRQSHRLQGLMAEEILALRADVQERQLSQEFLATNWMRTEEERGQLELQVSKGVAA